MHTQHVAPVSECHPEIQLRRPGRVFGQAAGRRLASRLQALCSTQARSLVVAAKQRRQRLIFSVYRRPMLSAASDLPSSPQSLQKFSPSLEIAVSNVVQMETRDRRTRKGCRFQKRHPASAPDVRTSTSRFLGKLIQKKFICKFFINLLRTRQLFAAVRSRVSQISDLADMNYPSLACERL